MSAQPERVLAIHEHYQQSGGEDAVFAAEVRLLRDRGHTVETMVVDNATIPTRGTAAQRISLAADTIWSRRSARDVSAHIRAVRPDVVHVHNTLPLLSPAIFWACHDQGVATVLSLHNYRLICPAATLYRDGRPCHDCVGRTVALPAVVHGCYRSRAESGVVTAMLATHALLGTWTRKVDRLVALSEFARGQFVGGGMPPARVVVKPNFLDPDPGVGSGGDDFLFAGRQVPEKGVRVLIDAWRMAPTGVRCRIVGTGPLEAEVRTAVGRVAGLSADGQLARSDLMDVLGASRALIVPSTWYEGFPVVILEAFARAVPVIASRLGSLAEMVEDGVTGLLVAPNDPAALAAAVRWAAEHPAEMSRMGAAARTRFLADYTADRNYPALRRIYQDAIARRARSQMARTKLPD